MTLDRPPSRRRSPKCSIPGGRRRRRHIAAITALSIVAMSVIGFDVANVAAGHRSANTLNKTRHRLVQTRATITRTRSRTVVVTATRDARRKAQVRTVGEIASANESLTSESKAQFFQGISIGTLHTCLDGVAQAVAAISAANLGAAVNSIDQASSSCLSLDGSTTGLVYPYDFPDPFILPVGGTYYGFATNSVAGNIQIIRSTNLTTWTTEGDALPNEPVWAKPGSTWGPAVLQRGSTFVLYYSAVYGPTGEQCISEAVATQPQGPYVDSSTLPLMCQTALGGSIDPAPFVDADGSPYLVWKSQGGGAQPPQLWSQQLDAAGTALMPGVATPLLAPSLGWQGGVVEGPSMVLTGGRYYLFYSANNWETSNYAIGAAMCTGPLGPCTETSTQPLLASQSAFDGPGGPSVFTDSTGQVRMAFHAWLPGKVGFPNSRLLFIRGVNLATGTPSIEP